MLIFSENFFSSIVIFFCRKDASRAHSNIGLKESLLGWASKEWGCCWHHWGSLLQLLEWQELLWPVCNSPLQHPPFRLVVFFLPIPCPFPFSVSSAAFPLSSAIPPVCLPGVTPELPPWPPWVPLAAPGGKQDCGLHLSPPDAQVASPFPLLPHPDELHVIKHDAPLGLTAVLWRDSETKDALFVETTVWKLCRRAGALPAAKRQEPRYP